jgi:hypothetical protein
MNNGARDLLAFLRKKHYIGNKHCPENWAILAVTRNFSRIQQKEFHDEYKRIINLLYLIRLKKRTGKGSEWHISIHPKRVNDVDEILTEDYYE